LRQPTRGISIKKTRAIYCRCRSRDEGGNRVNEKRRNTRYVLPPKKAVDQNSLPLLKSKNEKQNAEKRKHKQSDFSKRMPEISLPHAKRYVSHLKVVFKKVRAFNIC
jgi:hypothetical protein